MVARVHELKVALHPLHAAVLEVVQEHWSRPAKREPADFMDAHTRGRRGGVAHQ